MAAHIKFDLSWQLWDRYEGGKKKKKRKHEEMRKCYETRPVGKSKETPLKDREKG